MSRVFNVARTTRARIVLIHSHRHASAMALGRLASHQGLKMVTVEHHPLPLRNASANLQSASALMWSRAVVFLTSENMAGYPLRKSRLRGLAIRAVIPNGVELAVFEDSRSRVRDGTDVRMFGMAARLVPTKDIDTLLRATAILLEGRSKPRATLALAGDGPERTRLTALAADLGISESVSFLGQIPESSMPSFLQSLDVYVQSTPGEAFSTSLVQACAAGLPIVASDVPGISEVFHNREDALLVEPRNPSALAAAIGEALAPERAEQLGAASFRLASSKYASASMAQAYLDLFARIDPEGPWQQARRGRNSEADTLDVAP